MSTTTNRPTPRIYVACLAAYNSGRLHGRWIDANQHADDIRDQIDAMLGASPDFDGSCEWAIHDHEGLGAIGENEDIDRVSTIGQAVAAAGDDAPALLAWLAAEPGRDVDDFSDVFRGSWDSLADYVEQLWDEMGHSQEAENAAGGSSWHPARYVDWDRMARDLELSGDVETIRNPSGVYVSANE